MADEITFSVKTLGKIKNLFTGKPNRMTVKTKFSGHVLEMEDVNFHFDSAVLLPDFGPFAPKSGTPEQNRVTGLAVLYACYKHAQEDRDKKKDKPEEERQRLLIAGHTDRKGGASYNLELSNLRAENIRCALLGDKDGWVKICIQKHKVEDYQQILKWIAWNWGWDCDPGNVDNKDNPETRSATKRFQVQYNAEFNKSIPENGVVERETWGAFFDMYMRELKTIMGVDDDGLATARASIILLDDKRPVVGCGENFPKSEAPHDCKKLKQSSASDKANAVDRRVELLFFDPEEAPKLECHATKGTCAPTKCDLYCGKTYSFTPIPLKPVPLPSKIVVRVFLKLVYLDPEDPAGAGHVFPKKFPVKIVFPDGSPAREEFVGDDGALSFEVMREKKSFTLRFDSTDVRFFASPTSSTKGSKDEQCILEADVKNAINDHMRVFRLPQQWGISESDWEVKNTSLFEHPNFKGFESNNENIGSEATRVEMRLNPHWQYVRFEYFDRFFGHSHHDHKRVSTPPLFLEGFRGTNDTIAPEVQTNWMINETAADKACQCIPWILQKKPDGTPDPMPSKNILIRFTTEASSYVVSENEATRTLQKVTEPDKLKPSADRLKLYDLPPLWKSAKYFTRIPGGSGSFFEDLTQEQINVSLSADKPLIFSLDDIVLTNEVGVAFALNPTDVVAVFYHGFKDPKEAKIGNGKKISTEGLYNPGSDGTKPFFPYSDLPPGKNYISDYPDWTRLVMVQGNLYDVFDQRTAAVAGNDVVGARAAVRWVDATKKLAPSTVWKDISNNPNVSNYVACTPPDEAPTPGRLVSPRPGRIDSNADANKRFFSIQPFYAQDEHRVRTQDLATGTYNEWEVKNAPDGTPITPVPSFTGFFTGRSDMVLLRCCDVKDGKELAIAMQYFRFSYDFTNAPATNKDGTPFNRANYKKAMLANMPVRWNGPDGKANAGTFAIVPKSADGPPLRCIPFWFVQEVPRAQAHFKINVISIERANMNGSTGIGNFSRGNEVAVSAGESFVAAHELGHGGSLPDEYNERWSGGACSYEFRSFGCNVAADPFAIVRHTTDHAPMMFEGTRDIHSRYFWHMAEWVRLVTGVPVHVEMTQGGSTMKYSVRGHPSAPKRAFTYFPLFIESNAAVGTHGKFDLYLHQLGEDPFRAAIVPGKTFDGLLTVFVKIRLAFPNATIHDHILQSLASIRNSIYIQYNKKFQASGNLAGVHFDHCLVQFEPRFLVENLVIELTNPVNVGYLEGLRYTVTPASGSTPATTTATQADYTQKVNAIDANNAHPRHFMVTVSTAVTTGWANANTLNIRLDVTTSDRLTLGDTVVRFFGDMVGLNLSAAAAPNNVPTKATVQNTIVRRAIPDATVADV